VNPRKLELEQQNEYWQNIGLDQFFENFEHIEMVLFDRSYAKLSCKMGSCAKKVNNMPANYRS
jgi:hypothetical protein